jgi:hypothetical protein
VLKTLPSVLSAVACGAIFFSSHASAGFFTKDVPKNIIADASTVRLSVTVVKEIDEVASKLRSVSAQCGGDNRRDEAVYAEGLLVVSWMSPDTVSYILSLHPVESATEITVYMNSNVSRQKRGWPKIFEEWFTLDTNRCIPEIMRDA